MPPPGTYLFLGGDLIGAKKTWRCSLGSLFRLWSMSGLLGTASSTLNREPREDRFHFYNSYPLFWRTFCRCVISWAFNRRPFSAASKARFTAPSSSLTRRSIALTSLPSDTRCFSLASIFFDSRLLSTPSPCRYGHGAVQSACTISRTSLLAGSAICPLDFGSL